MEEIPIRESTIVVSIQYHECHHDASIHNHNPQIPQIRTILSLIDGVRVARIYASVNHHAVTQSVYISRRYGFSDFPPTKRGAIYANKNPKINNVLDVHRSQVMIVNTVFMTRNISAVICHKISSVHSKL